MESLFSILLFIALFYLMMRFGCGSHMHGGGCGHSSHGQNQHNEKVGNDEIPHATPITHDPVCGMQIEAGQALYSAQYGPETYYFCSKECYRRFEERPESFAEIERTETRHAA